MREAGCTAALTCLRPSLLPRRLRPGRRGRTWWERQKKRRVNRVGGGGAAAAPSRGLRTSPTHRDAWRGAETWLRPHRGSRSLVGTHTQTHRAPARRPPGYPRPTSEGRAARARPGTSGEARPARSTSRQGRGTARREEEKAEASLGAAREGLPALGAWSAGAGAAAAQIARRV